MISNFIKILSASHWQKALSGLCVNLSAAWFGLAFITPNFADLSSLEVIFVLIRDCFFGIVFLSISAVIERGLEK